jgi:hypothetical protein
VNDKIKHWYRKLPEIGYAMKPYVKPDGKVYLPNRGKGNYDAELYFGRGVKFNGTDQSVTLPINETVNTIAYFKDGVFVIDETKQTLTDYVLSDAGTYQNIIFYKGLFEPHEKRYLESNSEKFLYHEKKSDGTFVAKSEILSQSQIDDVVAHFPMCDTDEYVRNMIGYSEGAPIIPNTGVDGGFQTTDGYKGVIATIEVTDTNTIKVTDNSTDYNSHRIVTSSAYQAGTYRIKIKIGNFVPTSDATNTNYLIRYNTDHNGNGGTTLNAQSFQVGDITSYTVMEFEGVCVNTDDTYFDITASDDGDGSKTEASFDVIYWEIVPLTSTYPIANFTNAARDNAKNLQTGLQTCFLKRDVLGVPIGSSFNELSCGDGVVKTNYVENINQFKQYEFIVSKRTGDLSDYGNILYSSDGIAVYARFNRNSTSSIGINSHSFGYTNVIISGKTHFVITSSSLGVEVFANGVSHGIKTTDTPTTNDAAVFIGSNQYNRQYLSAELPLFKVHTTPQDPAKLYTEAVKKGLLS